MRAAGSASVARLDPASRAWLEQLRACGPMREAAIGRLHAILLSEARYEVRRRTARLSHPSGPDLEDLAIQAADDALMAVLGKLDQFRGDALFTTWARRFATLEVPSKIRRRLGHARETPVGPEHWSLDARCTEALEHQAEARETIRAVSSAIASDLTGHQREVLLALTIEDVPAEELAARLDSTAGALYKTLHDARHKLRSRLQYV